MEYKAIRKQLRKGELAVAALEELGYKYAESPVKSPEWVAPVSALDTIKESIEALIKQRVDAAVSEAKEATEKAAKVDFEKNFKGTGWPNYATVSAFIGKRFKVHMEKLPPAFYLNDTARYQALYNSFVAKDIVYIHDDAFRGYVVKFNLRSSVGFGLGEEVIIPLSCAAFGQ